MDALVFDSATGRAQLQRRPVPEPKPGEALIKVLRAGVCSTDLEICRGYVPGYCAVLGHEFVGSIVSYGPPGPTQQHPPIGTRVVGEINCNDAHFTCSDAVFQRNHAPGRSVLGIINRDGTMAEYLTLPVENLHPVPHTVPPAPLASQGAAAPPASTGAGEHPRPLTDREAVFAEPLAAACRVVEQGLPRRPGEDRVAVIGDGKLGLLVAQVLAVHVATAGGPPLVLLGRHSSKMDLVVGSNVQRVVCGHGGAAELEHLVGQFDLVVEASGSAGGIRTALALCRPMGTVLLKSTVSTVQGREAAAAGAVEGPAGSAAVEAEGAGAGGAAQGDRGMAAAGGGSGGAAGAVEAPPLWAELANDIVVNEKVMVGSRCGPFDKALELMARSEAVRQLLGRMVAAELPLSSGEEALQLAAGKGVLKVQLVMG